MLKSIPTDNVVYDYKERSFILFSVENLALVKDFQSIMPHTQHFCNKWNVPFDYMLGKLREKGYLHKMLSFAYDIHGKTNVYQYSQLVQENYFHTTKREWCHGKEITVTKYEYDVYIIEDNYVSLCLNKIIPDIIKDYYGWLFVEEYVNKFRSDLPDIDTKLSIDTYTYSLGFNELTLEDIAFICNNPTTWRDYKEKRFIFNCYDDMLCCRVSTTVIDELEYDNSIIIPVEAIVKRDWGVVENYNVYSIRDPRPLHNRWYEGKQNKSPYWDTDKVKEIQKLFEK